MTFKDRVLIIVANIPPGATMTYQQVAQLAGNAKASRAVGMFMSKNINPHIPCHRVIRSDGGMGGYRYGGVTAKIKKLQEEGAFLKV